MHPLVRLYEYNFFYENNGISFADMMALHSVGSADYSKVIARIGFYNIDGNFFYGGDFEMTDRIQSAYEIVGKALGDFLKRKAR